MALFIKKNGMYQEVSDRLSIKEPGQGNLDYEDSERMKQIAQMITNDIDQSLRGRERAAGWRETNPVLREVMEKGDPAAIRLVGTTALMALTKRWTEMENPIQRKAEMLVVLGAEAWGLQTSMERGYLPAGTVPPFMVTLWGMRF